MNSKFIEFSFDEITTRIFKGEEKKVLIGLPLKWPSFKKSKINANKKCRAIITGKKSNITVLDFDDAKEYENIIVQHPELKNYYSEIP